MRVLEYEAAGPCSSVIGDAGGRGDAREKVMAPSAPNIDVSYMLGIEILVTNKTIFIVSIAVGAFVGILLFIAVYYCCFKRKGNKEGKYASVPTTTDASEITDTNVSEQNEISIL